jgi:hypothetical protein
MTTMNRMAGAVLVVCSVALPSTTLAQGSSGIAGVVRDPSGAVLPGVTVEASSPALIEKVRSVVTDGEGQYRIVGLPPGVYAVTFSLPSFSTFKRNGVELAASFTATVNADLRIGALEETVTVSGQSPVVDVQNTTTRKQITREALDTVPTNKTLEAFAALTPGITMGSGNAQDVGGSKGETYVQLQVHGSRVGDAKTLLDGFETNEWSGRVFVPNPAGAQEVSIDLGNGAAEAPANGVYVNFVLRDGGNTVHGTVFGSYTNSHLQSVQRLSDDLRARGLSQSDLGRVLYIWDTNGSVGGPVQRDRLWFHHAMRSWGSANAVVGGYYNSIPTSWFYAPDLSRPAHDDFKNWITSERLTLQATPRNKFNINYDQEYRCDCHRTVSSTLAPEAAAVRTYHPKVIGVTWDFPATSRLLFSAGTTANSMNYRPGSQPETPLDTIGVVEASTGVRYRAVGPDTTGSGGYGDKRNFIQNSRFSMSYVTGTHNIKVGMQMRNGVKKFYEEGAAIDYQFRNQTPTQVTIYAYPLLFHESMKALMGIYAQDQWTMKRLTLNGGVRFDYENAYLPAQHLDAGPYIGVRDFAEVTCVPCWKDFSPRISAAYDLFGTGKTAVKVSVGRYTTEERLDTAHANNPLLLSNSSSTRAWADANGDFIPQENELGPLGNPNFGKTVINTRYADDVLLRNRPANWSTSVAFQHELRPGTAAGIGYFRTAWQKFTVTNSLSVTSADYTPYCVTLPADPRLPGGGGNHVCGFYDINTDEFGQDTVNQAVVPASNFGRQTDIYEGIDLTVNSRLPGGAFVQGGMNTGRQSTDSCYVSGRPDLTLSGAPTTSQRSDAFCAVTPPFFRPQLKVSGSYDLPWDFQVSGVVQSLPGIPITASYVATNADVRPTLGRALSGNRTTVTLTNVLPPQTVFEKRLLQVDLRFIRNFKVSRARLQVMFDAYNVLNNAAVLSLNTRYGASWLRPTSILDARLMKFGVQTSF